VPKSVIRTRYGHYKFLVIPFGLANTPLVFMDLMNQVFHEYLDFGIVAFTNDMLVYLTNCVEHERHLVTVFEVLREVVCQTHDT
jgi:hypothetical protein